MKKIDRATLVDGLSLYHAPNEVFEIRIPKAKNSRGYNLGTVSGYFDQPELAAQAILDSGLMGKHNIYHTVNTIDSALLARAYNRLVERAESTTSDSQVQQLRVLTIDIDPKRPAGISATEDELQQAMTAAQAVTEHLAKSDWQRWLYGMSGNGTYLQYRLQLPNSRDNVQLIQRLLEHLASIFNNQALELDTTIYNPSRILKVWGTVAVKGDSTPDRPHRLAVVTDINEAAPRLSLQQLMAVLPASSWRGTQPSQKHRPSTAGAGGGTRYTESEIEHALIKIGAAYTKKDKGNHFYYELKTCLLAPEHGGTGFGLQLFGNGGVNYHCHHNTCSGKGWPEAKPILFPNGRARRPTGPPALAQAAGPEPGAELAPATPDHYIQSNGRHHKDVSGESFAALVDINTENPRLFVRGGQLTRIGFDEHKRPVAQILNRYSLKYHVDRSATFFTRRTTKTGEVHDTRSSPPLAIIDDILAYPEWPGIPSLLNIVTAPVFSADGQLCNQPGYHPKTKLYYYDTGTCFTHTPMTVNQAKRLIDELIAEFPFNDAASKANTVSLLLLPFVRPIIAGPTPLYIFSAPTPGTGKSLLANEISKVFTGQAITLMTAPDDNADEWRKRITSTLADAPSHVLIDNVRTRLDSSHLAAATTAPTWSDRYLGQSKNVSYPITNIWIATGNNIQTSVEIGRRSVWIVLDALCERPWERTDFTHLDLTRWARQNRPRLINAAINLIQHWVDEGMPHTGKVMGSYENYAAIMDGILSCAGIEGFLENTELVYEKFTTENEPWKLFVMEWYEKFASEMLTTKELLPLASYTDRTLDEPECGLNLLGELIHNKSQRARESRLGRLLKQMENRVFENYQIKRFAGNGGSRKTTFQLQPVARIESA